MRDPSVHLDKKQGDFTMKPRNPLRGAFRRALEKGMLLPVGCLLASGGVSPKNVGEEEES